MEEPYGERVGGKLEERRLQKPTPREREISKYKFIQKKCIILFCINIELSNNLKIYMLVGLKDECGTKLDALKYAQNI